jgi:hypothetical protein
MMSNFVPHMPEVDVLPPEKLEPVFAQAAEINTNKRGGGLFGLQTPPRQIAIITPGRMVAQLSCPAPNSMDKNRVRQIEHILPAQPPRKVVAIAYTELAALMGPDKKMSVPSVSRAIPFIGFLLGFGYIGHTVIIFEGHPSALAIGLRGADLLLVDALMIPALQKDWVDIAYDVMRSPTINVYQPDGRVQQIVKKPQ